MRIKICCIGSVAEARLAIARGADALGLVSEMPTSNGVIPDALVREIAAALPPGVDSFLLTSRTDPDAIVAHQRETGVSTLQLVDRVAPADLRRVKRALPDVALVQVVHVTGPGAIAEADSYANAADALLLDSGTPDAPVRALGGTGRVHDWELSRRIAARAACPVILAGGLDPANVARAVRRVRPAGVDVCSGLRPRGALDPGLLESFVRNTREAG